MRPEHPLASLDRFRLLDLTTFKRSGVPVATPVRFAIDGDRLVVSLQADSGKVLRLRADPHVRIAGHRDATRFDAHIRELSSDDARAASNLLKRRYRFLTLTRFVFGRRPRRHVSAEIRI